jgi:uncharacterized protein YqfA (UPF0365 family)
MLRHFTTRLLLPPLLAFAAALQSAHAQTPSQRAQAINGQTLANFAEAYLDIFDINAERDMRARAVQDPRQVARLDAEADSAVQRALAEQEMTLDEYEAIEDVLEVDAEMRQEFEVILARVRRERETTPADTLDTQPTRKPGTS